MAVVGTCAPPLACFHLFNVTLNDSKIIPKIMFGIV